MDSLNRLLDAADRSSVVIYSIDPRGVQTTSLTAADNPRVRNPRQLASLPMRRSEQIARSQDGLVRLADQTGGLFLENNNDICGQIRKVMQDARLPSRRQHIRSPPGRARFHKLSVKVKREGLPVRHRSGFLGNSDRPTKPIATTPAALLTHALNSPFASGQIHLRLTGLFSYDPKTGPYLNTLLYIDPKDLKFEDLPDGHHKAIFDLLAVTFDENGNAEDKTSQSHTLDLPQELYDKVMKNGIVYELHHIVKKPGPYQMRLAICDPNSDEVGSATQFVEVPDVSKGRLTISSVLVRENDDTAQFEANPNGSPAVRIFRTGHELIYAYQVLNAGAESGNKPDLDVQTRLFRDGEQVYEGKPMPLAPVTPTDPKNLIAGGEMKLGAAIKLGDYVLQVIVTDKTGGRTRTAAQSADFQVR